MTPLEKNRSAEDPHPFPQRAPTLRKKDLSLPDLTALSGAEVYLGPRGAVKELPAIPFNKPTFFKDDFDKAIGAAASYGQFSGDGINSKKCQKIFSDLYGYERALLTPSCTAALEMAALILDIGPGDEVIVPSFTFVTSASAFALRGACLVFADSENNSPNVSVDDILAKVTPRTKAIVVVHYAGVPVDVRQILDRTGHSIRVVEDCAHAIASVDPRTGDYVGKNGCLATFSFHETKNISIGEGGMLVVNDESLWRKAQIVREKGTNRTDFKAGRAAFYTWVDLGSSFLMSEVDAAILWSCLVNVDLVQRRRLRVWDIYDQRLASSPDRAYKKPSRAVRANAHMYYLECADPRARSHFVQYMKSKRIVATTHYLPLDSSPFVEEGRREDRLPRHAPCVQADKWSKCLVRLPLFADIFDEDLERVISAVNSFSCARLVPAEERYWDSIRKIRNDNSECFTHADHIPIDAHWNFMRKHHGTYRVAIQDGKVVGFIGHVDRDARLATNQKGGGIAQFMWGAFVEEVGDLDVKVLPDNARSMEFFRKLGYRPVTEPSGGEDPITLIKG